MSSVRRADLGPEIYIEFVSERYLLVNVLSELRTIEAMWHWCWRLEALRWYLASRPEAARNHFANGGAITSEWLDLVEGKYIEQIISAERSNGVGSMAAHTSMLQVTHLKIASPWEMVLSLTGWGTGLGAGSYGLKLLVEMLKNPARVGEWLHEWLIGWFNGQARLATARSKAAEMRAESARSKALAEVSLQLTQYEVAELRRRIEEDWTTFERVPIRKVKELNTPELTDVPSFLDS